MNLSDLICELLYLEEKGYGDLPVVFLDIEGTYNKIQGADVTKLDLLSDPELRAVKLISVDTY